MNLKLIVAGSRGFCDYQLLSQILHKIVSRHTIECIISGTANGADQLGALYAQKHNIPLIEKPANWNKYGKKAGYLRNQEMAEIGNALLAFWDGKSPGTKHMIDIAKAKGLKVRIIKYES